LTYIDDFAVIKERVTIGENTIIGAFNIIESGAKIGKNVTIQPHCVIARDSVIEDNVFIAPHFSCANDKRPSIGEHGQSPNKKPHKEFPIHIGEYSVIGTRCTVAPGVKIGKRCFIKMNCNIYDDVPDDTTVQKNTTWSIDYD
jgi:UDP-3-O-[3-hydroxymyristoyl] glucosamine N-acyltransferase